MGTREARTQGWDWGPSEALFPLTLFSLLVSATSAGIMAVDVAEHHLSGESQQQACHLTGPSHQAWGAGFSGTPIMALFYW